MSPSSPLFAPHLLPPRCQLSNRMYCLRHHLKLAGLLNRTLVIPVLPREVDMGYDYRVWRHGL